MAAGIKMTIVLPEEVHEWLKEYAYVMDIRSKNTAATQIITKELTAWIDKKNAAERHQ